MYMNILLGTLLVILHLRLHQYAFDDAYIHIRVAQNFLNTGSPYFNTAEVVKVSTSSGWVIYLTSILFILRTLNLEDKFLPVLSILNSVITFAGAIIFIRIINKFSGSISILRSTLFTIAFTALMLPTSAGLMETSLGFLLTGLGFYRLMNSKKDSFILLGVSVYIRPEMVIALGLGALLALRQRKVRLTEIAAYSAIGIAPFLAFDLFYYHTVLPQSIAAKSIVYLNTPAFTLGFIFLYSLPEVPINGQVYQVASSIILIVLFFLTGQSAIREWRESRNSSPLFFWLWGGLTIVGYVLAKTEVFPWYIPLYTIPILTAATLTTTKPEKSTGNLLLYVLFAISTVSLAREIYAGLLDPGQTSLFKHGARVRVYISIGNILQEDYPSTTLLIPEIGGLGYSFRGQIYDAVGLASPDALKFHPLKIPEERDYGFIGGIPPQYVEQKMPGVIVSYDIFSKALLKSKVLEQYNLIFIPAYLPEDIQYSPDGTVWGNKYLRIYIRKDLPISEKISKLVQ